ncbi:hypothetical protein AURDEDRAFT_177646, partial [Auricularia subglabra TFB-10046 SS5]
MWVQSIRRVYKSGRGIAAFRHRLSAGCSSFSSSCHHHLHRDLAAAIPTYRGDFVRPSALPAALSIPGNGDNADGALARSHSSDPSPTPQSFPRLSIIAIRRSSPSTPSCSMTSFKGPSILGRSNRLFSSQPESSNTLASSHSASAAAQTGRARRLSDPPEHITDVARSNCSQGRTGGHRQHVRRTPGFGTPS